MRMRLGDMELDTASFDSLEEQPEVRVSLADDLRTLPQLPFVFASAFAIAAIAALILGAWYFQLWWLLIPAPFAARFAAYSLLMGIRPKVRNDHSRADLLRALEGSTLTADALAGRLGWSERRTLQTLVPLIESGEVEEDLDLDSGRWFYRRAPAEPALPLPATDRLHALEAHPTRRQR